MKEYDDVKVIVEKERYAKEGVHKGMVGTILDPRRVEGDWLVVLTGNLSKTRMALGTPRISNAKSPKRIWKL